MRVKSAMLSLTLMMSVGLSVGILAEVAPEGLEMPGKLPKLKGPVMATTLGQSPGSTMVKMLCRQVGLTCSQEDLITASQLQEACKNKDTAYKTLVITMGTSLKGMGAADVDIESEVERGNALIGAARKLGIFIMGAQIEGASRRTDETDEKSNHAVAPQSDLLVVMKQVNNDGYFTNVAKQKNIPIILINKSLDFAYVLRVLFALPDK